VRPETSAAVRGSARSAAVGLCQIQRALERTGGAAGVAERIERDGSQQQWLPFLLFPASELLERHARLGTAHASLTGEILDVLAGSAPTGQTPRAEQPPEPLSATELRVLRYLPTNLPAPEIASEMFVSVNTIRTHTRHLYSKLDVHTRAQAVERARELGLLAPNPRRR